MIDFTDLLPIALLGAVFGLDVVSFPQSMISRPLVAATAAGAFTGHPAAGLLLGIVLELIALETLPVGASRYPEWGSASVVGGAIFSDLTGTPAEGLTVAVLAALVSAALGGWSMVMLRRWNALWARRHLAALARGSQRTVVGLQVAGMTADLVRGLLLTAFAVGLLRPAAAWCVQEWTVDGRLSRAVVVAAATTVAAGAVWKNFHSTTHARWYFLGGLALGMAVMVAL